jgi:hypothetical protein
MKAVRYGLILVSTVQAILAVVLFLRLPWAIRVWPFHGTSPMTFTFVSSIFAAAAAATLWAVFSENYGALAGIGLDYITILSALAFVCIRLVVRGNPQLMPPSVVSVAGALFGVWLVLWSIRIPLDRTVPLPSFVRWSFGFFIVALVVVSAGLILQVPNVIPWDVTPEDSVVIGWMFLGASIYFAYGLLRPCWVNAAGQLAGFLAYDVVLIGPFVSRLPSVTPAYRLSLIAYTLFVTSSGIVAVYYLLINRSTRLGRRSSGMPG